MKAVSKPMGLPNGMSPQPAPMTPTAVSPGTPAPQASPGTVGRTYGQGYNPNVTGSQQVQRRGGGHGHYGKPHPISGEPIPREIPRSKWQRPEEYRSSDHRWSRRTADGRKGQWRNVRIPTTSPVPAPAPVPAPIAIGALRLLPPLATAIYILQPTGTASSGAPDWTLPLPDVPMQPMPGDQTSICGKGDMPARSAGKRAGGGGGIYQFRVTEIADPGNSSTSNISGPPPWSRSLGIFKVPSGDGLRLPDEGANNELRAFWGPAGKRTFTGADGLEYVEYRYWYQNRGKLSWMKKRWVGTVGSWEGDIRLKETDTGPRQFVGGDLGYWKTLPSRISLSLDCFQYNADEEDNDEFDNPNEYKREEDDKVACRWLTENNQDVNQLEMSTFRHKKFKGCRFNSDGSPDFYEEGEISAPVGFGASLVALLDSQAEMLGSLCELPIPPFALPDWMPTKWANMPKLVVLYAEQIDGKFGPAKYSITIPHWSKTKDQTTKGYFTSYTKGQYQCIFEMDDGARITVNGQSSNVAQSVIRVLQSGLPSPYDSAEIPAAGIRRGKPLKEIDVFPVEARFFEKGKEDLRPIWIKKFNN